MSNDVEAVLGFRPELGVDKRLLQLLRQRAFTTESLIKELVKNSYEAEAEALYITVHPTGDIEFRDEGKYAGMSLEDIKAFLLIGTPHKARKRFTEHFKRPIAGEQGIGRLSFTQLYKLIEVETEKDGVRVRFRLTEDMIDQAFTAPVDMTQFFEVLEPTGVNGTRITCMGLKEGVEAPDAKKIKQYISTNFLYTLLSPKGSFKIFVNGEEVKLSVPKGIVLNVEEEVEGVIVKGDRVESSVITGCIVLLNSPREDLGCGIQLSVNGSPIGSRRSLGELVGDRSVDEEIPPTKIWGWIEAPFLKYTIGRDNVDVNHVSYLKFKEKMLKVVREIKRVMKAREREEISRMEAAAVKEACSLLAEALKGEVELKPGIGAVSSRAFGGAVAQLTSSRLRTPAQRDGESMGQQAPQSPHQTHHVHAAQDEGLQRKIREKGSWLIMPCVFNDPSLLMMTDYNSGIIRVNNTHPLYVRRARNKRQLRNFLLWIAAMEISKSPSMSDEVSRNRAFARLLNKIEIMAGSLL